MTRLVVALALGVLELFACSSSLPGPPTGPHPRDAFFEVPYPPPPGHVEFVPPRPRRGALWIDGQWRWEAGRWMWNQGGWVIPPPDAYFARWEVLHVQTGALLFAPAAWRSSGAREVPAPPFLAVATAATPFSGQTENAGGREVSVDASFLDAVGPERAP